MTLQWCGDVNFDLVVGRQGNRWFDLPAGNVSMILLAERRGRRSEISPPGGKSALKIKGHSGTVPRYRTTLLH